MLIPALGGRHIRPVLDGGLIDPDSYMRLVRLWQTLKEGSPAHLVPNDGSGIGAIVHWSHLLDSLLFLMATPLLPFLDPGVALHAVASLVGPISLVGLGLTAAWAAAPFAERRWLWLAPLSATLGAAIFPYGLFGVVHHHVAIAITATAASGWAARMITGAAPAGAGWIVGAWAGAGLWLTPETLPLSVMIFGALWVAWLALPNRRDLANGIRDTGLSFLLVVGLAWAVDPPSGGHTAEDIDRVSVVFVTLAMAIAACGLVIRILEEVTERLASRLFVSLACGLFGAGVWAALYFSPLFEASPALGGDTSPLMWRDIAEMRAVGTAARWMTYLFTGCLAALALGWLAITHRHVVLGYVTLCGIILVLLGYRHLRFASYPETLAAVVLPIIVSACARQGAGWAEWRQSSLRLGLIVLFTLIPFLGGAARSFGTTKTVPVGAAKTCAVSGLAPMLSAHAGRVVLANINDTPELLYRTGILTVGSLYHRNPAGFLRLRSAWRTRETAAPPPGFTQASIAFVLFCKAATRSPLVSDLPETTLLDRLGRGEVPPWLQEIAVDRPSGHVLYRVRQ